MLVKLTIFIVGIPKFGIVYFNRYILVLCGKKFRFIDTLKLLPKTLPLKHIHKRWALLTKGRILVNDLTLYI